MRDENDDSEVEAPEKDSATSPSDEVEVVEDTQEEEASKDTPSIQEKRLAGTEKALQERQREFHEVSRQLAEVKGQMSVLTQQNQPVVKDVLDDESIAAKLRDDPSAILGLMKQKLAEQQSQFASVLEARDRFYQEQIGKSNPEVIAFKDKIAEFRKDPDLQGFSDQQLVIMAKKSAPRQSYRGAPGGQRTVQNKSDDVTKSDLWSKLYPDLDMKPKK